MGSAAGDAGDGGLVGRVLVAGPGLVDPHFARTVVLLLHHDESGTLGLILNRPSALEVTDPFPQWVQLVSDPGVVFMGGPVGSRAVICLAVAREADAGGHAAARPASHAAPPGAEALDVGVPAWRPVAGRLGTLDLTSDPAEVGPGLETIRVFAGYAGWAPGQLASELDRGGWLVLDSLPEDAVTSRPSDLWKSVLRRQGGSLALLSAYPLDPSDN